MPTAKYRRCGRCGYPGSDLCIACDPVTVPGAPSRKAGAVVTTGAALVLALLIAAACAMVGCGPSTEVRRQIHINAVVSDSVIRDWPKLDDGQRLEAYVEANKAFHDFDYSINEEPLPGEPAAVESVAAVRS